VIREQRGGVARRMSVTFAGVGEVGWLWCAVWSLGCVLFAMLFGYSPFECELAESGKVRIDHWMISSGACVAGW
jgi:hypothetical protein